MLKLEKEHFELKQEIVELKKVQTKISEEKKKEEEAKQSKKEEVKERIIPIIKQQE
jgi:hypothetical protein